MEKQLTGKKFQRLWRAFLLLENEKECKAFLRDLCTLKELEEMANRLEALTLIEQNIPYREISQRTGLSTATVTRIAHWWRNGEGGYRSFLAKTRQA